MWHCWCNQAGSALPLKKKVSTLPTVEVIKIDAGSEWRVIRFTNKPNETKTISEQLKDLLAANQMTEADLYKHLALPGSVVEHVHQVKSEVSNSYHRRLRPFSGKDPVPNGELSFEVWCEYAEQITQDASLKEPEKLARLVDILPH